MSTISEYLEAATEDSARADMPPANWLAIDASLDRTPRLVAALHAVAELHQPKDYAFVDVDEYGQQFEGDAVACVTCGTHSEYPVDWPCDTYRAIADALGVEP